MKILLIPLGWENPADHFDLVNSFRKDHEPTLYNKNLIIDIEKYDVVFYQGGLSKERCVEIKIKTNATWITWTGDVRYAPLHHLQECKEFTDIYAVPFSGSLLNTYFKLLGKPCRFIWEYFPYYRLREPKELNSGPVSFVGNVYDCVPGGTDRIELAKFLRGQLNEFQAFGSFPMEDISQAEVDSVPDIYQNSYLTIAQNNWHDIPEYFTPRNLQGMSSSCCLMKWFPGIEKHFTNWVDCVYYRHKYELLDVITYLKLNPEKRNQIARKGFELVREKYCLDSWVKQFINLL